MVAVCGIELAIRASFACGVPGTETSTLAFGLVAGIFAKSAGKLVAGNIRPRPVLQRGRLEPASRKQDVVVCCWCYP